MRNSLAIAYRRWKKIAIVIGTINSYMLFSILWLIGIGAYAIVYRTFRFMSGRKAAPASYWEKKEPYTGTLEGVRRQF